MPEDPSRSEVACLALIMFMLIGISVLLCLSMYSYAEYGAIVALVTARVVRVFHESQWRNVVAIAFVIFGLLALVSAYKADDQANNRHNELIAKHDATAVSNQNVSAGLAEVKDLVLELPKAIMRLESAAKSGDEVKANELAQLADESLRRLLTAALTSISTLTSMSTKPNPSRLKQEEMILDVCEAMASVSDVARRVADLATSAKLQELALSIEDQADAIFFMLQNVLGN